MLVTRAQRVNQLLNTLEHVEVFLGLNSCWPLPPSTLYVETHVEILVLLLQLSLLEAVMLQNLPQVFYLADLVQHAVELGPIFAGRLLLRSVSEVPNEIVRTVVCSLS